MNMNEENSTVTFPAFAEDDSCCSNVMLVVVRLQPQLLELLLKWAAMINASVKVVAIIKSAAGSSVVYFGC